MSHCDQFDQKKGFGESYRLGHYKYAWLENITETGGYFSRADSRAHLKGLDL